MKNFTYPIGLPSAYFNNNSEYVNQTLLMSIDDYPLDISYVHNIIPIRYAINKIPNFASNYKLILTVNGITPPDTKIVLKNIINSTTITASIAPRSNQFKTFPTGTVNVPVRQNEIAQSIILTLRNNATFNAQYTINTGSSLNTIIIEARNSGPLYIIDSITLSDSLVNANIISQHYNTNVSEYYWQLLYRDVKIFTEVYVANGSYGEIINKLQSNLVDTLSFNLYAEDYTYAALNESLKTSVASVLPASPYASMFTLEELDYKNELPIVRPYYFSYGIQYRNSSLESYEYYTQGISKILYVSNSGTKNILMDYNYNRYILDLQSGNSFDFLTDYPTDLNATEGKIISRKAIEYLHFYKKFGSIPLGNLGIEIEFILNDNTSYFKSQRFSNFNDLRGVLSVEVSPHTVNVNNVEITTGLTVKDYIVRIFWTNGNVRRYSNPFKYTLKADCNQNSTNILFLNRLGVFETIEFQNLNSITIERSSDTITSPLDISGSKFGYITKADAVKRNFNLQTNELTNLISIPYPNSHLDWATQLASTSEAYIWSPLDNSYKCIIIEDFNISQSIDTELFTIEMSISNTVNNTTI